MKVTDHRMAWSSLYKDLQEKPALQASCNMAGGSSPLPKDDIPGVWLGGKKHHSCSSTREKRGACSKLGDWEACLLSMGKCKERFQSSTLSCLGLHHSAVHLWLISQDEGADNGGGRP